MNGSGTFSSPGMHKLSSRPLSHGLSTTTKRHRSVQLGLIMLFFAVLIGYLHAISSKDPSK